MKQMEMMHSLKLLLEPLRISGTKNIERGWKKRGNSMILFSRDRSAASKISLDHSRSVQKIQRECSYDSHSGNSWIPWLTDGKKEYKK